MTKKNKETKGTKKPNDQRSAHRRSHDQMVAARSQAIEHEEAGRWSQAAEAWSIVERLAETKKAREEAAGRKAAAEVRARPRVARPPRDEEAAPPAARDAAPAEDGTGAGTDATGAPTGEPGANEGDTAAAPPAPAPRERDPRLPPAGTVLIKKDRKGVERARCTIAEDGVEYAGTTYKSPSAAAMAAAKDLGLASKTQDGYAFWGLKKAASRGASKRNPIESLEKAWERYRERAATAAKGASTDDRPKVHDAINQHLAALHQIAAEVA